MISNAGRGGLDLGRATSSRAAEFAAFDALEPELRRAIAGATYKVSAFDVARARGAGVPVERCIEILRRSEAEYWRRVRAGA